MSLRLFIITLLATSILAKALRPRKLIVSPILEVYGEKSARRMQSPEKDNYKPLAPPMFTDDFKNIRADWYKWEKERLDREKAFHASEFERYTRQQKWNDDRKALQKADKAISEKVLALRDLDEQAIIDIDDINARVNYKQNLRNPANREKDRAWRKFDEANNKAWTTRVEQIKSLKIPISSAKSRRIADLTADQKKKVEQLEALWVKRVQDLQAQIDLNLKFHTVEFEEFVLDSHRLEDTKAVWESALALNEKRDLTWSIMHQYNEIKGPTKTIINKANETRKKAQNVFNGDENAYNSLIRGNKQFTWATSK